MSKRTIIIALIAILLIGAALFSALMDGKPKQEPEEVEPEEQVPEQEPEEEIPVPMPENFTIHKFEDAKVTPSDNGTNEENKT